MGKRGKKISWKALPVPKVEDANNAPDNQRTGLEKEKPVADEDASIIAEYCSVQEADFPSLGKDNPGEQFQETSVLAQVNADLYWPPYNKKNQKSNSLWNSHSLDFSGPHLSDNNRSWFKKSTKKQNERLGSHENKIYEKSKKSKRQFSTSEVEEDLNMVNTGAVGVLADDCTPPRACRESLKHHVSIRLDDCIVVLNILWYRPNIWVYNLWTEGWMKYRVPQGKKLPPIWSHGECTAVAIESDIYIFGTDINRTDINHSSKSLLWKLTRFPDGSFEWNIIHDDDFKGMLPLPRICHCAWEYGNKMWIWGGSSIGNELLCFDPSLQAWSTLPCSGDIPSSGAGASLAILDHTLWLYGREHYNSPWGELYELNMDSFVWTQVETSGPSPLGLWYASLTPTASRELVLHGSKHFYDEGVENKSWIFDVASHTWRQHMEAHIYDRYQHSGITDLYGNVLIIGGKYSTTDIERKDKYPYSHRSLFSVTLHPEPKTLQQMAVKMIYKHRAELPWKTLPLVLIQKLMGTTKFDDRIGFLY